MGFGSFFKKALPAIGTVAGGAVGSVVPGVGTAAGASIGGGLGALGSGLMRGGFGSKADRASNEFRAVDANLGRNPWLERQQTGQITRLRDAAMGRGPSLSDMAARAALEQGRAQLESQAVSDRRNPALARRTAMLQGGMLSARLGQQAMMGRIAEQQQAEQALAQAMQAARAADLQRAGMIEDARTKRFGSMLGVPTQGEVNSNMLSQTLPMLGQAWDAWKGRGGATFNAKEAVPGLYKPMKL